MKRNSGETFISLLIALAIFAILSNAIFTLTTSSFKTVSFSKARIVARHLAEEKIETIRNMPYDNVGTSGGVPAGTLLQTENKFVNGLNFVIKTSIVYIDDPFDGQSPADLLPTDYKRVRIDVSWGGAASSSKNPVVITTDIAPKGIEKAAGGGTLSVLVFDANAIAVSQAEVHIESNGLTPAIDITQTTNDNGRMIIPGIPQCTECYDITVTKSGYSTDKTYTITEVANPSKPRVSIVEGSLTEISFTIDKNSTLNISTLSDKESLFVPIPDTAFIIRGQKIIGTDIDDFPVFKFEKQFTTSGSGTLTITDVEWDNYTLTLPETSTYDIGTSNPLTTYSLLPDQSLAWLMSLYPKTDDNLKVSFVDALDSPIPDITVTLTDSGTFNKEVISGGAEDPDFGQVFFPGLVPETYTLNATSPGYTDITQDIDVNGPTQYKIIMDPATP